MELEQWNALIAQQKAEIDHEKRETALARYRKQPALDVMSPAAEPGSLEYIGLKDERNYRGGPAGSWYRMLREQKSDPEMAHALEKIFLQKK